MADLAFALTIQLAGSWRFFPPSPADSQNSWNTMATLAIGSLRVSNCLIPPAQTRRLHSPSLRPLTEQHISPLIFGGRLPGEFCRAEGKLSYKCFPARIIARNRQIGLDLGVPLLGHVVGGDRPAQRPHDLAAIPSLQPYDGIGTPHMSIRRRTVAVIAPSSAVLSPCHCYDSGASGDVVKRC